MKTKKLLITPIIFLLILCIYAVPASAAAPGKVTGVKAKQLSEEKIKLIWNAQVSVNGYEIYQKTGSQKYKKIKTTGKVQSLTVKELELGETYYFRVRAYKKSSGKKVYGKYSSSVKIVMKKTTAETKVFTVSPKSNPYQNKYVGSSGFTEQTRSYYVLRSYLEYFANVGGGELHLKKGTYNLLYCLYIPSNTTIVFEDGVTIKRMDKSALFTLCSYNDLHTGKKFYGYNGVHDIKLIGKGTVIFRIENNSFSTCKLFAIRAQNWEDSYILNNIFSNISASDDSALAIDARGISNVIVKGNTITNSDAFMKIIVSRYSDDTIASRPGLVNYEPVYNSVKEEDVVYNIVSGLKTNYAVSYVNSSTHQGTTTKYWNARN